MMPAQLPRDRIPSPAVSVQSSAQIVVAGALISAGALLVAQRTRPPQLAGLWELPGGKAAPGETDAAALARELREELGVEVAVGPKLAAEVALGDTTTLRAYRVTVTAGTPRPHDHHELRWVRLPDLAELPWVPADRVWLDELVEMLRACENRTNPDTRPDKKEVLP